MMLLPPLEMTDLYQTFTGGTLHHLLPPCKISSKSERFKYQTLCSKINGPMTIFEVIFFQFLHFELNLWCLKSSDLDEILHGGST